MSRSERRTGSKSSKASPAQPRSWEDVNQRLGYLGEMERQIRALRDQFEQKVAVLKQQLLEATQPVAREKKKLEEQIECFYWAHREEVLEQGRKSLELAFGRVGSRRSRSLVVEDAAAAQQWLTRHGLERFLRVRTELDREGLRSVLLGGDSGAASETCTDLLGCPGLRLRDEEEFWYEADATRKAAPAIAESAAAASHSKPAVPETRVVAALTAY